MYLLVAMYMRGTHRQLLVRHSVLARGRAQVSVAAAVTDWPKRIRDMRYADHEDYEMAN